ncbi:MAG: pilin [Patescibacteria group bacterium]
MTRKVKSIMIIFAWLALVAAGGFLFSLPVAAQDFGVEAVESGLGGTLSSADPRMIIGRIIQIALSFLGVLAVVIIMYAGFIWTTSGGDEEKITKAKNILKNAVIGLVIVLSSWGITTFLLSRLSDALGITGSPADSNRAGISGSGTAAIGACAVDSVYPADGQKDVPRNTSIMVTLKEKIKTDTLCINSQATPCVCDKEDCNRLNPLAVRLYKSALGDSCSASSCPEENANVTDVLVTVTGEDKTFILSPLSFLGSASGETAYSVKLSDYIKKTDDSSMFTGCNVSGAQWEFTVSDKLDLTPPLVVPTGVFPIPDNIKDIYQQITPAAPASAAITVLGEPAVYAPAEVISVTPATPTTPSGASVILDYHGSVSDFIVSVPDGADDKVQLFDGANNLLGIADLVSGQAVFNNYLTFKSDSVKAEYLWNIKISPERLADTLEVGGEIYSFAASGENNNILVPDSYSNDELAKNITAKLSGREDLEVFKEGDKVILTARVAGEDGNNISLTTTAVSVLGLKSFSGGTDLEKTDEPLDKKDRPMNSVIQVNFNEAINPATVSGTAGEVAGHIRVVNAATEAFPAGAACSAASECRSYKCENNVCVGDYLGGKFVVSNNYKTLEFISDVKCGVNGCGEEIYCLPANSHLAMEMLPANLKTCESDSDCSALVPFINCRDTSLGYKTCQDDAGQNYPAGNLSSLDGIVDAAINSFDGDRSAYADGPLDFYHDNYDSIVNAGKKDKYKWSFYINDQIALDPPVITEISPSAGQSGLPLVEPVKIKFNTLMMNSTLQSGGLKVKSGTSTVEHRLINLSAASPSPLGYWMKVDNLDVEPLDGEPDLSIVNIFHSPFAESMTYKVQVGSGVKDIYQNCYKPSIGPGCSATDEYPSCCFGVPTDILGTNGSCQ